MRVVVRPSKLACFRSETFMYAPRTPSFVASLALGLASLSLGACGGNVGDPSADPDGATVDDDAASGLDASAPVDDAHPDVLADASAPADTHAPLDTGRTDVGSAPDTAAPTDAGAPRRLPCAPRGSLASDLPTNADGALEGELVSIVPPGSGGACPNDTDHLHLQILVGTSRYDVAITINDTTSTSPMGIFTKDIASGPTAAAGWSSARFDYPTNLGVHSTDFTPLAKTELVARWLTELKDASHVSVHGLSYSDGTGLHDVHRNGGGHDGVVLVHRGGGVDHAIAERFATSVF